MNKNLFQPVIFIFIFSAFSVLAQAATIHLNDGRVLEGRIVEKNARCIRVDLADGIGIMTYCSDEIKDIDGLPLGAPVQSSSKLKAVGPHGHHQAGTALTEHIRRSLQHLGYPRGTWGPIEKQIVVLLTRIDFPSLKKEALQVRSDPEKLTQFVEKLGGLLEKDGYIDRQTPHPLIKLLTTSFAQDDISQVIFTSPTSFLQKVDSKKSLVACTAISQLGSIVLELLGIQVRVAFSPGHVFNCIPLNARQILFVDFSNQVFPIVDINKYYLNLGSRTMLLKDEYRIPPSRILEINAQLVSELRTDPLQELLCFLYDYIYVSDDDATTPAVFINLGNIYAHQGNYDQAISYFDQAIQREPEFAEAYRERGITYGNKGEVDQAIADLGHAIELFPEFADAYHDRASIYSAKGDLDSAVNDLNQALIINPDYAEAYHDRGKVYSTKGDIASAIDDYSKAIAIDPYFSEAYQSRAQGYFLKDEYDKSWEDVHKVEDFGDEVDPDLLEKLKKTSQLKSFFLPALIIAPILVASLFFFF